MSIVTTDNKHYTAIADSIRTKTGTENTYTPEEMPEGVAEVYKAGQSSMVDESKIIEKTVSGTNIVVIDDTSEIPHDVGCKVESVNLFGLEIVTDMGGNRYTIEDNVITNNMALYHSRYNLSVEPFVLSAGSYKLSFDARKNRPDGKLTFCTGLNFSDGTKTDTEGHMGGLNSYETWEQIVVANPFVLEEEKTVTGIMLQCVGVKNDTVDDVSDAQMQFKNIMLNRGDTALPYTPYVSPENVTITRYGANLFDCLNAPNFVTNMGTDDAIVADRTENSITIQKSSDNDWEFAQFALPDSLIGQKITVYAEWTSSGDNAGFIRVNWDSKLDGASIIASSSKSGVSASGVVPEKPSNATHLALLLYAGITGTKGDEVYYKNVMVNVGDKTLKFEPYNGQTVQANADGTVDGIKSLCPVMTLSADVDGVVLTVDYHKSWGKQAEWSEFWDSYQLNGTRTYYTHAFAYQWTDVCFKPKYDIRPANGMQIFYVSNITDVQACLDKAGVVMDLSQVPNFRGLVSGSAVTRLGVIDTTGASVLDGIFNSGTKLHTVELLILKDDGSQTQGQDRPFANANSLENITVQGKFGLSFSMQWCPLSKESIMSVVNALLETATEKTLTLSLSIVNTRFETSEGAADGSTSEEWLNLVATKSNWTITLV